MSRAFRARRDAAEYLVNRDYTHGPLNVIVYALPSLQDDPQAAVAFNSMLNLTAWAGDDEFFHTWVRDASSS